MFYPVDSLKRGGRFYLCWIADSWPLRFEKITQRTQRLWSQDIREICDHLRELMNSESGRPINRFSLRLSSQLMRGLARIYQKKVDLCLRDVWKINNIYITRHRCQEPSERQVVHRKRVVDRIVPGMVIEEVPDEDNLEKLLEKADNFVARVEDITLREPTLHPLRLIDDGFGELNQDPVELMLAQDISAMQQSVLDLPLDFSTDKSHDKSRLAPHDAAHLERISEHDMSVFGKSAVEAPTLVDFEKAMKLSNAAWSKKTPKQTQPEIPEISEILPPELPAPEPLEAEKQATDQPLEEARSREQPTEKQNELQEIVLEPLEELEDFEEPQRKRRKLNKLIIDKTTQLSSSYLRARIACNLVETRCLELNSVACKIERPLGSMARFGYRLGAMYTKRLENERRTPVADRDVEEALIRRPSNLEGVQEKSKSPEIQRDKSAHITLPEHQDISNFDISARNLVPEGEIVSCPQEVVDIADLPTQKLLSVPQEKRASDLENAPKRTRKSQQLPMSLDESAIEANKENMPGAANIPATSPRLVLPADDADQQSNVLAITSMLQAAGLTDEAHKPAAGAARASQRRGASEGSETPLGSLDRTSVSLGSEKPTTFQEYLNTEWGVQGTMVKILKSIVDKVPQVTLETLVHSGPLGEGRQRIIMARCFASLLKLKSHGFINIVKEKETNEIKHIEFGQKIKFRR